MECVEWGTEWQFALKVVTGPREGGGDRTSWRQRFVSIATVCCSSQMVMGLWKMNVLFRATKFLFHGRKEL
jgi:hypothetical protein